MLKRRVETKIDKWIKEGHNALLVNGARQVGKTFIIRQCLAKSNRDYLEINLIEQSNLIPLLNNSQSVDDLVFNISLATGHSFIKNETILFIDEVQECKDIVTKIKFWVDESSFKYILSGSLLGVEIRDLRSAPVGYIDEITMFPLDFQEFLLASGVPEDILEKLKEKFLKKEPLEEAVHNKMMQHFSRYLVVGGMPSAVNEYISSGNVDKVTEIQKSIIAAYKRDFTKYEASDKKLMLEDIYDLIPSELLKQNRRFIYADLGKGLKFDRLENSFLWHTASGTAICVFNSSEPRIPLKINKQSNLFKLYLSDVGLLTCQYDNATRVKLITGEKGINFGGIYENAVAQQLLAHGYSVYYYNSHKQGELDFVIEHEGSILPIEVKSGKDYHMHSAISNVTENSEYGVARAIVFSNYNISESDKIEYYPVYMSTFLEDNVIFPILEPIGSIEM